MENDNAVRALLLDRWLAVRNSKRRGVGGGQWDEISIDPAAE